jgi:hypothetical protein
MMFAVVDLGHTLRHRLHRLGQLIALNNALHLDLSMHERGEVSGIWVVEVQYLGSFNHQLLVLVGDDALQSPLLKPHIERRVATSALIDFDVAAQRPVLATCRIPDMDIMYSQNELAQIQAGYLVPREHNIMDHTQRLEMTLYIVTSSLRNVNCIPKPRVNSINAFSNFWTTYNGGGDVFKDIHLTGLKESVTTWTTRFAPHIPDEPPVLLPDALDDEQRDELWPSISKPSVPIVETRSSTPESMLSNTDTILKIAEKLDQRIDDMEKLWKVGLGGKIWATGPSPAKRLYFGAEDAKVAW